MLFDLTQIPIYLLSMLSGWVANPDTTRSPFPETSVTPVPLVGGRPNKLLFLLFDGFRWDYVEKFNLTGFRRFEDRGSHASAVRPEFPTLSIPNYYSLATGMYPEKHGIVANSMFNPLTADVFDLLGGSVNATWWQQADPLWVTATRQGLRTRVYLWPGCDAAINGIRPDFCRYGSSTYYTSFNLQRYLAEALTFFEKDEADLIMIYHESPDLYSSIFGADSWVANQISQRLSRVMCDFTDNMDAAGMSDKINVIITSDHGMTNVNRSADRDIRLSDHINTDDVIKLLDYGANTWIYPVDGKLDQIYAQLSSVPGLKVTRREDIPVEYHVKDNERTPPLLVEALPGYYISPLRFSTKQVPFTMFSVYNGYHGFNVNLTSDMKGILIAAGPDIQHNVTIPEIETVDVYALAANLLHLAPKPINGSVERVAAMLITPPNPL